MLQSLGNDLKKILLAGIGAAAVTAEKSQQVVAELVRRGLVQVDGRRTESRLEKGKINVGMTMKQTSALMEQLGRKSGWSKWSVFHPSSARR